MRRDDEAAIQVFEAIIVAVIILTAVLFYTTLQRPTQATDVGGVDLGVLASDVLVVLAERNFTDPEDSSATLDLVQWVSAVMNGSEAVAEDLDDFMIGVLGPATKYELRLDNGVAPMRLLPFGPAQTPLAARGAASFIVPSWDDHVTGSPDETVWPGAPYDCEGWTSATSPDANTTAVDKETDTNSGANQWVWFWKDACGANQTAGERLVPLAAPYGYWKFDNGTCSGCTIKVTLPPDKDGLDVADYPVYGLELLLWRGG